MAPTPSWAAPSSISPPPDPPPPPTGAQRWSGGEQLARAFCPGWRKANIARAERRLEAYRAGFGDGNVGKSVRRTEEADAPSAS